jgi:hypothetical protein
MTAWAGPIILAGTLTAAAIIIEVVARRRGRK